ncbi:hypothetical protein JI721_03555 [Alicyclobacillus cycloheptanicus]|uniref:Spo0E like sporulation regulatory protein n=1 Tax=Alicyclobacillus cycloheptanicus TaxID=1457 RepID=A0ABT9XHF3_9BACL|nr:hypothetical protein [Alicyclobacillus cycloheptanicus]MDQ0189718.1 hypothetical protein [Alicyclobacillus cycloheptanicus]WDM01930.1 hypothetical protein JI721_03555 [Alicyclobacillus cycloheptanicus]
METGAEIGYQDAIRQVLRSMQHRIKSLEEALSEAGQSSKASEIEHRIAEVRHLIEIVNSLHR